MSASSDMRKTKSEADRPIRSRLRDNPEQYPTEKESLFDRWESERTVDPIPVEDLTIEQREEKEPEKTKKTSSSERKYKP